jgi:hypothetical protein
MQRRGLFRGSINTTPNTFIGGVAADVPDSATLASILTDPSLPVTASDISVFNIVGNDIEARINVNYLIQTFVLASDGDLRNVTYYRDLGKCVSLGGGQQSNFYCTAPNLVEIDFPVATYIGSPSVNMTFKPSIQIIKLPSATTWGSTTGDNNIFWYNLTYSNTVITANSQMQTINGGSEEGDLAKARARGATINYV